MEIEHIINKELTFKPSLCVTPKSISNLKFENFQIRQQNFLNNKNINTNKLKKNIEGNAERNCSFSPYINKIIDFTSYSSKNNVTSDENNKYVNTNNNCESYYSISTTKSIPAHVRLFNDSKRRNSSFIQKEIEYKKSIKDMANRTSKNFLKVNLTIILQRKLRQKYLYPLHYLFHYQNNQNKSYLHKHMFSHSLI